MGQYYRIINLDKQEYLDTYTFNDGAKLLEFGCSSEGTLLALAILLADGNGRGGGDLKSENLIIGSWAGDRIVVAGDYADEQKFLTVPQIAEYRMKEQGGQPNLYYYSEDRFENISRKVLRAMLDDNFIYEDYMKRYNEDSLFGDSRLAFEEIKKEKEEEENERKGEANKS